MADEIIIDVQVNTSEVQQKLSAAIKDLSDLKAKQTELTKAIKEGKDANGEQAKQFAENEAKIKSDQAAIKSLTAALQVSSRVTADNAGKIDTQNMTLDEQRQLLGQLQKAYGGLTPEQKKSTETGKLLSEQINALNKSVVEQEKAIGDHRRLVGSYEEAIKSAFGSMVGKLKAFFANPWAALVGAIVIAFRALVDAFKGSEDRMRELQTAFAPFEGVINTGKQALEAFAKVISGVVVTALGGLSKVVQWVIEKIDAIGDAFGQDWHLADRVEENRKAAESIAKQDQALIDKKRAWEVEEARINSEISELRAKAAEKDKYTTDQRVAFMERARDLELKAANTRKQIAQDELNLAQLRAAQSENDAAANNALAAARANVINQTTDYNNKVRELNGTISELVKQTEEYKASLSAGDLVLTDEDVNTIVASYMNMGAKVAATMEELQEEYGVNLLKREEEEEDVPDPTAAAASMGWTEEALEYYKDLLSQGLEAHTAFTQAQEKNNEVLAAQEAAMQAEREKAMKNAAATMATSFGQISDLMAQYGKENEAAAKASKAFALMQVLLANGVSIAEGAKGMAAGMASAAATPFPANIAAIISVVAQIGAIIGTVASTIAQAKQIVQGASAGSFEGGGVVGGTSYTGDKLTANVNSTEVILNREQQANTLFNMAQARHAIEALDYERLQACIEAALMNMPNPVLVYSEFEDFTQGVESNKVIYTVTQ